MKKGAHVEGYIRKPDIEFFRACNEAAGGMIKLVTLAPNMEGSEEFIRELHNEVVISIGHTAADYGCAAEAMKEGSFFNTPEGQAVSGRRYGSSPQIGKIQFGYVSGQQDIRVQINDPAVLREQAAGHQAGIRKGGVAVLVAVLKELAEFFRKLQERKGNLRKGGGDPVQPLYYSRVHSVVNDVNVIKASGTGVKAKGVNGYAQGQAPAAGGGKHDGDA